MTLTADIATHLQADGVGTIRATTDWGIYENQMPAKPDKCISVFAYGGAELPYTWAGEFPDVQVRIRGAAHDEMDSVEQPITYAKAYAVMTALHKTLNLTINSHLYHWIAAKHTPASLGRDQKGRDLFVVNFKIIKETE